MQNRHKELKSSSQTGISKKVYSCLWACFISTTPFEKTVSPRGAERGIPDGCFYLSFLFYFFNKKLWYYVCVLKKLIFQQKYLPENYIIYAFSKTSSITTHYALTYRVALTSTTMPFACRLSCRYNCAVLHQRGLAHVLLYYFQCWHMVKMTQAFKIYGR